MKVQHYNCTQSENKLTQITQQGKNIPWQQHIFIIELCKGIAHFEGVNQRSIMATNSDLGSQAVEM